MALFDSDFLKKLEYLSLVSRRVFRGSLLAQRRTMQLGGGIEFADHREYTPGDDFRYLDWNLYARHDELLLKRFQEEEDLHVYFLLDCSRSMGFGEPPKFDFARQVTAALAYIALADLDRVAVDRLRRRHRRRLPADPRQGPHPVAARVPRGPASRRARDTDLARVATGVRPPHAAAGAWPSSSATCTTRRLRARPRPAAPPPLRAARRPDLRPPRGRAGHARRRRAVRHRERRRPQKVTVTERNLRQYQQTVRRLPGVGAGATARNYGLGCTRTSTEIPFDELILRMMRIAGAVR